MEFLKIERTESTPEIMFDADGFLLSLKGALKSDATKTFLDPLINLLNEFYEKFNKTASILLNIEVKFSYINSASILHVAELFKIIEKINTAGVKVIVSWYYSEEDELIYEIGQEISEVSGLPFNYIEE